MGPMSLYFSHSWQLDRRNDDANILEDVRRIVSYMYAAVSCSIAQNVPSVSYSLHTKDFDSLRFCASFSLLRQYSG